MNIIPNFVRSLYFFLVDLYAFVKSINLADAWLLITTLLRKVLFPNVPEDDRENLRDKNIRVMAKAPQDNMITKYLIGAFLQELWDRINKPFVVAPPKGVVVSEIPINWKYRLPDGRGNSAEYPVVGMGNTKYATIMRSQRRPTANPAPEKIFNDLIKRREFVPHPNKINVFMFYFATLITGDLFSSLSSDHSINTASSYADMQFLYGRNQDDQDKIRTRKNGELKPDFFADTRIPRHPPGVGALLVLFSRNHNWIARQLIARNERDKFNPAKYSPKHLDEKVFQTARLINGGCYVNLIINDYLRMILGLPTSNFLLNPAAVPPAPNPRYGNQCLLSFNYVYRWHSSVGEDDEALIPELFKNPTPTIEEGIPIYGLRRNPEDGTFSDEDLAITLRKCMKQVAGHLGALNVPEALLFAEVNAIKQGRTEGLIQPTLNEFRAHFNLKKYKRFEDINNDMRVVAALKGLYNTPDDIELTPGLLAEQTQDKAGGVGINEGIALGYTTAVGILADAVNLIRNDRFYTTDFNAEHLTDFGWKLVSDPAKLGLPAHNGSVMAHLFSMLGNQFHPNEPCVKIPFKVLASSAG